MTGAVGMLKNGVPLYPYLDEDKKSAWERCELDFCNAHSAAGEDFRYYGDPFGSKCLYNTEDYPPEPEEDDEETEIHPP